MSSFIKVSKNGVVIDDLVQKTPTIDNALKFVKMKVSAIWEGIYRL